MGAFQVGVEIALAPMRPKEALFSYGQEAPSFDAIRDVIGEKVALVGFPSCVGRPGEAALLTRLYFRSQRRAFSNSCERCTVRSQCEGVVVGHLGHWGDADLRTL